MKMADLPRRIYVDEEMRNSFNIQQKKQRKPQEPCMAYGKRKPKKDEVLGNSIKPME